jgi:carboxylesterase type B
LIHNFTPKGLKLENQQTGKPLYEFRGIRYGKPPVGPLRFKQPVPVEKWEDTLDATTFGANFPSKLDDPQKESRKYSSYN